MTITQKGDHFHISFGGILATATKGIHRASAFAGFSLNAAARPDLHNFHPAGAYFQWMPDKMTSVQIADYKSAYRVWVIGNAIRELVESFGILLNGVYFACSLLHDGQRLPPSEIRKRVTDFEQKGELKRLQRLKADFDISSSLEPQLESLIAVRNTITHRWGQVVGKALTVRWRRIQPYIVHADGTETVVPFPLSATVKIDKPSRLHRRVVDVSKTFSPTAFVEFEPHELQEICMVFNDAATEIVKQAEALARKLQPAAQQPPAA